MKEDCWRTFFFFLKKIFEVVCCNEGGMLEMKNIGKMGWWGLTKSAEMVDD